VITPGQRTFIGAAAAQITASVALFTGHLTGDQWVTAITLILFVYSGKSVAETYIQKKQPQ